MGRKPNITTEIKTSLQEMNKNPLTTAEPPQTVTGDDYWHRQYDMLRDSLEAMDRQTIIGTLESIRRAAVSSDPAEVRLKLIESLADTAVQALNYSRGEKP